MPSLGLLLRPLQHAVRIVRTARRTAAAVPDVVEAILVLPELRRDLERIAFQTATLPEMYEEIRRVHGNTASLPRIDGSLEDVRRHLEQVEANTQAVDKLALRLGRLADRWPQRRPVG